MDYTECKDIYDFYEKTGMNRQEAFVFLLAELNKMKLNDREILKGDSNAKRSIFSKHS